MPLSVEDTAFLQLARRKALEGTATLEELKRGTAILRQDRVAAQTASTTSRTKAAAARVEVDPAKALAELRALGQKLASGPVA